MPTISPQLTKLEFATITPSTIHELTSTAIGSVEQELSAIGKIEATHQTFAQITNDLFHSLYQLNLANNLLSHLSGVNNSEDLRKLEEEFLPKVSELMLNVAQSKPLFAIFEYFSKHSSQLTLEEARIVNNEILDSRLNGLNLPPVKQAEFNNIAEKLSLLSNKFENNLLDSTNAYTLLVTLGELAGVPEVYQNMWHVDGDQYRLTLKPSCYMPIMQYCTNRKLRETIYYNYVTRASELTNEAKYDNTPIINEILGLRQQLANLVDFDSYASYSLENKMAHNYQEVYDFLYNLATLAKPQALQEVAEVQQHAKDLDNLDELAPFDYTYYSEKLQQHRYNYSSQDVKNYFQLGNVLSGLLGLVNRLFNIQITQLENQSTWDNNVKVFALQDAQGGFIGNIYMDLHARDSKQSGAWMNGARDRYQTNEQLFTPIAYIICNFDPLVTNQPCLISFDEVQTLFHEMGHALHHTLTKVDHFQISGINGVEWDAVELPSQLLENFVWDYTLISQISSHYQTKAPLPQELFDKMNNSRYFHSAIQTIRQMEFSLFDLEIHHNPTQSYPEVLNTIRSQISVLPSAAYNRFANSFGHIFAGGYAAGYYSYKWAELLSSHVYSLFDNQDIATQTILGERLLHTILSKGGLRDAIDNFQEFTNSTPQIEHLLKYTGISK